MIIALKLCLHSLSHFLQSSLYFIRLRSSRKNCHSCLCFLLSLGMLMPPFSGDPGQYKNRCHQVGKHRSCNLNLTYQTGIYSINVSQSDNNSSSFVTMRFCSLSGGRGNTELATLSLLRFFTTAPLTFPQNCEYAYPEESSQ